MKLASISLQTIYNHRFQLEFNMETWCIQEMYWYYLYSQKYNSKNCQKTVIRLGENIINKDKITCLSDVALIEQNFDFESYFTLSKYEKKRVLLDTLHQGILKIADKYEWEKQTLKNAYEYCLSKKIENSWLLGNRYLNSPSRKHKAGIICHWDIDKFEAFGVILEKSGNEVKRVKIFEKEPHKAEFIYYSKSKWEDSQTFSLFNKNKTEKWSISPD